MNAVLELEGVVRRHRRGSTQRTVLDAVSFRLERGEFAAVLASRGQGKTTLLRIAAGIESPDEGSVRFEGRDLARLGDRELSRLLGDHIAWAGTAGPSIAMRMIDYVAMPLLVAPRARDGRGIGPFRRRARRPVGGGGRRDAHDRAHDALARVGASGCAGQHWETLGDWERALVEIAQAIAGEPRLLLIDDLTDTLGIRETDELTGLVRELSRETELAVLMSVSDGQAALRCDRILTLSCGSLFAAAPRAPAQVIELPNVSASRHGAGRGR